MATLTQRYIRFVVRHPVLVLFAILVATAACAQGVQNFRFTSNYRVYFGPDNPQLQEFDAVEADFSQNDVVVLLLTPDDGKVFTRKTLAAVVKATDEAWQTPFSTRVDSVTNFQHTYAEEGDIVVEDLIIDPETFSIADLVRRRNIATREPALAGRLIDPEASITGVSIKLARPGENEYAENKQIDSFLAELAQNLESEYPHIEVRYSGLPIMDHAFAEATIKDLKTILPGALAIMTVALIMMLRSIAGTVITLIVIALSVTAAMGFCFLLGYPLSPATAAAPTVIMTVAVADCVHLLMTYFLNFRKGMGLESALGEALRVNLMPMFITSVTTAIGFLSLNFSEVPPFRHLGNTVAFGVMAAFLFSITYMPAQLAILGTRPPKHKESSNQWIVGFAEFVISYRRWLVALAAVTTGLLLYSLQKNELNDVFVHYFDDTFEFRRSTDYMTDNLTGIYFIDYALRSGEPNGATDPAFLKEAEAFAEWLRAQPEVKHVNVITDTYKRVNRSFNDDNQAFYRLPENAEEAGQLLLLYEMSVPFGLDLNDMVNIDKSSLRVTASIDTISSKEVLALEERAQAYLLGKTTRISNAKGTGAVIMMAAIGQRNIVAMLAGTAIAFVLISDLLILALGSLSYGIVSLLPNLIPSILGFGVWALLDGQISLSLSLVASLTLGIVVDDTVHFLSKYLRARREYGYSSEDAVRYTMKTVGPALITTSLVLVLGFLVLATSHFYLNASMGLLTSIIILLALVADLLFLPPILMTFAGPPPEESDFFNPRPYEAP